MLCMRALRHLQPRLICALAAVMAAACSTGMNGASRSGLGCVDDSPHCIEQRRIALNAIMSDKSRSWVRETPTPEAYASGVRLFAFKTRKAELSCDELATWPPRGRQCACRAPQPPRPRTWRRPRFPVVWCSAPRSRGSWQQRWSAGAER